MKLEELLSKRNMRIINLASIGVVTIANFIRFYYFGERERFVEKTVERIENNSVVSSNVVEKTFERDSFWMFTYTLFLIPVFIFIFILQELQVSTERLAFITEHFKFLDYHIGKGLYLLLLTSFILQHEDFM